MADLKVEGDELVLELTKWEKTESMHGDVRVPRSSVRAVEILDDAHGAIGWGAIKMPGTRIPGIVDHHLLPGGTTEVGTFRGKGKKSFAVVHHDTPRGLRVQLEGADYDELVVGCADPESIAATLQPVA
jgi:hypothetical protein